MKRIIINADDFGYIEGVVRGTIDLHQAGVVSSTSCMTNMPAWPQAVAYLREHPGLGAGVHLVFSAGYPVLPAEQVPALVNGDGAFLSKPQILRSLRAGTTAQLRVEFRAQVERFIADVGRAPDHLDSHSGISYIRPDRFNLTVEVAQEYGLPMRMPFGDDLEAQARQVGRVWGYPARAIRWIGRRYRRRVDRAGIPRPNAMIHDFSPSGPRTAEHILSLLETARDGWTTEFLTHPGYDGEWREEELRALLDPRVQERLREADIELVTFAAVGEA